MSLQGPIVVVADKPAPDLVDALGAAGAFPVVQSRWAKALSAFVSLRPSAIVLAEPGPASDAKAAETLRLQIQTCSGPFIPVIGRARSDADASASRLVARLAMALQIRALHAAVLRRMETFSSQDGTLPTLPQTDPLDDATVLVADPELGAVHEQHEPGHHQDRRHDDRDLHVGDRRAVRVVGRW